MSSMARRLQKRIMLKRGFQPDYRIRDGKIVKDRFPLLMPKKDADNATA